LSKIKNISDRGELLSLFVQRVQNERFDPYSLRASPVRHGEVELRVEAQSEKAILPVWPILYPSRKLVAELEEDRDRLLLCPHLPEPLAEDLRAAGCSHADLNGRFFVQTPWLLLDRRPTSAQFGNPKSQPDVFSLKTSRVVRALLAHRDKEWTQEELTHRTLVSRGLISRVLKTLQEDQILEQTTTATRKAPAVYRLSAFDRLLDGWKAADKWEDRVTVQQYSVLSSNTGEIAKSIVDSMGVEKVAFTQWFAAHLRHPYTTPPLVSAYVKNKRHLDLPLGRKVNSGGNLWLVHPADDGVFLESQRAQGFQLVTDVQIYLDLIQMGQRGPDQADALRKWEGFGR
jgi:hypothetical protein